MASCFGVSYVSLFLAVYKDNIFLRQFFYAFLFNLFFLMRIFLPIFIHFIGDCLTGFWSDLKFVAFQIIVSLIVVLLLFRMMMMMMLCIFTGVPWIYLFEYSFLKLLEWFQFWPYLKLLIVFWLVIPDFGRAFYVYNHLVCSCISVNPQVVIHRFNNWKKLFVKKENFLLQAEKYIKENGTEALEQLTAGKNATHCLKSQAINAVLAADPEEMQQNTACCLAAEAVKPVPARERKEMPLTNGKGLHVEQKDIKDLEMIDKKEVPASKNGNPVSSNLPLKESTSSAVEAKGMAGKDAADEELPNCSVPKEVQKEWTCAICQLTIQSDITLDAHLHGRQDKA